MGDHVAFPTLDRPPLGVRLNRWLSRWNRGGIEPYSLCLDDGASFPLLDRYDAGIEVSEHCIWITALPEPFSGFRIVQLTDIHHGLYFPLEAVRQAVERANELAPDCVALTGDFVTYSRAYIEPVAAMLGRLRARYGVFAVLGNHDFRVGGEQVARALRRHGITVLRNRHTAVRRRTQVVYVAGVDDVGYGADLARALRGMPRGAPTLLLAHNPRIIRAAARHGVSLVLSGHTHGGQVNLPLVGTIYGRKPEGLRYKSGWDSLGATQIYVSRGIGTIVLPLRVRCPAEIPRFELLPRRIPLAARSRRAAPN